MDEVILGSSGEGPISINIPRLVESRMLIQANSGAGKSFAIRRILEQSHGSLQHIVIDVEDEFHTLREKYDYVLAGRTGGDCPAEARSAAMLARRLLELQVSAIIGIYELPAPERIQFVRVFLESLVNAPRELWHPVLVVIDESHLFAPEESRAESTAAVIDLMTRGRKRGFCGLLATQRISKLHKDAAAEANNKLIGRSALDVDMDRASRELGFTKSDPRRLELRTLPPGQFYAFGPALTPIVTRIQVGPAETTHPHAGQRAIQAPPPRAHVQAILAHLADIPKEAREEEQTIEQLRKRLEELEEERLTELVRPEVLAQEFKRGQAQTHAEYAAWFTEMEFLTKASTSHVSRFPKPEYLEARDAYRESTALDPGRLERSISESLTARRRDRAVNGEATATAAITALPEGEHKALTVICQHGKADRAMIRTITGYKRSTVNTYLQRLEARGLIQAYGSASVPTEVGRAALGSSFQPLPTGSALREKYLRELPEGEATILRTLCSHGGHLSREDLTLNYAMSSRNTYIQRLAAKHLVVVDGKSIRASSLLFDSK